ncbi:MAG: twin-arginine translocase TatA/TatE family subunit [Candidatus Woesebacteria bacterium]|nr:MAG: twin-arginine translocase TatA/TatE family subunit [Candidatus Woesebacteria bacterium]
MLDFIKNISPTELVIIALILIVFFGSKVVINLSKGAGETFREIKKIKKNFTEAIEDDGDKSSKKEKEASK